MSRAIIRNSFLCLALFGVASAAVAHHPPRYERCQRFRISGQLERIQWVNPHVLLFIRTDLGETREFGWLNVQGLERAGIHRDTLRAGDHVVVEGGVRPDDTGHEPILLSSIRRTGDGWEWSQPLEGC